MRVFLPFALIGTAGALALGAAWLSGGSLVRSPAPLGAPAAPAAPEAASSPTAAVPASPEVPSVRSVAAVTATAALAWRSPATISAEAGPAGARATVEVALVNTGAEAVVLPALRVSGDGLSLAGACPNVLPADSVCRLSLIFRPDAVGEVRGRLSAGEAVADVLAQAGPELGPLVLSPVATADARIEVEARAAGPLAVRPGRAVADGVSVSSDGCAGRLLRPGDTCRVGLRPMSGSASPALLRLDGTVGGYTLFPSVPAPPPAPPAGAAPPASAPPWTPPPGTALPPPSEDVSTPPSGLVGPVVPAVPGEAPPPLPLPEGALRR